MSRSDDRVLAIGIDAAEPSLIQQWMDRGELPSLRALVGQGIWGRVASPTHIGRALGGR